MRVTRNILMLRVPSRRDDFFNPGRMDALQDQADVESFAALEPVAEDFRPSPE